MRTSNYIAIILICLQLLPVRAFATSYKKLSVAVVPVHNGQDDASSDTASEKLTKILRTKPNLHVIAGEKVESVLRYYDRTNDTDLSKIEGWLSKAKENYFRLNYIEAKSLVRKVISSVNDFPNGFFDYGRTLLDAYLTLGIINRSMGNVGEARQAFKKAVRLDPNYKLDSRAFSPSMTNLFENVRSSLEIESRGSLKVASSPKVAEVYLNGVLRGVTPLVIKDVHAGIHHLKIAANKYKSVRKKINVEEGKTTRVKEKLVWTEGEKGKLQGKTFVSSVNSGDQVDEGLRIAGLLRADKVIMVDVEGEIYKARMVDAAHQAGHKSVSSSSLEGLSGRLFSQTHTNVAANPVKYTEPIGKGDSSLLGEKNRSKLSKPVFYGIIGGVLAAGLAGGLIAAFAGGGGGGGGAAAAGTGSVTVNFK